MGHITRDVAIGREIHRQFPDIDLRWVASPMATQVLLEEGEQLLPESSQSADYNGMLDKIVDGYKLDVMKFVRYGMKPMNANVRLFREIIQRYDFDLIIGDEIYEIIWAMVENKVNATCPVVMIHDFLGGMALGWNPLEKLLMYLLVRKNVRSLKHPSLVHFFVGENEDVPAHKTGFCSPDWRELAEKYVKFLGYVIRFNPDDYQDKATIRAKLGYKPGPLIVCALGGGSVGKGLLELCSQAYPYLIKQIPNLQMVTVGGALFSPESVNFSPEILVKGYVPNLHEHFAASDLAIVVGGGTSTVELTALKRPFIYFPLEQQFDQQIFIPRRLARHRAGLRMEYRETSAEQLANVAVQSIGKKVDYANIPVDGARKAAELIGDML